MTDFRSILKDLANDFHQAANTGNVRNALSVIPKMFEKLADMIEHHSALPKTPDTLVAGDAKDSIVTMPTGPKTIEEVVTQVVEPKFEAVEAEIKEVKDKVESVAEKVEVKAKDVLTETETLISDAVPAVKTKDKKTK